MDGRYVAYYRVSRASQGADGLGIEAQKRAVANYLNGGSWELLAEFTEVETGAREDRPQLAKAMAHCRMTGSTLIIAKLDRLSRDVHFLTGLGKQGVEFVACDLPHANQFTVNVMASLAQHERELISRRTKEGLQSIKDRLERGETHVSKTSGKVVTRLGNPNGLKHRSNTAGNAAKTAKADAFAQMVGDKITGYRADGLSMAAIASKLTEERIRAPRGDSWSAMAVKRVLDRLDKRSGE